MLPKTPEQFRKWLTRELKRLGGRQAETELDLSGGVPVADLTPEAIVADLSESDLEDAAETIRQAGELALQAHLPGAYRVASGLKVPMLTLNMARVMLAEMLQAIPEPAPSELLSVKQAAARYNIGERTLYRLLELGDLRT